ncbi:MAG TPA: dTMP kinase [Euzebyales bacterium]|nr:dTMP kinase [Euzebyales bacterium]
MAAGPAIDGAGQTDPRYLRNPATVASYRALLAKRNYRLWFFAALITSLGDWAGLFALQILVTSVAESSRVELFGLGGIMMARLLPSLLIGPVAGVLADRYPRRRMMVAVDIARGVLFCVMAFSGDLVAIFALTFLIETLALLFMSAKDAMLPSLVEPSELTQANQLNFLVTYGPLPFGAALAAAMVGLVSILQQAGLELEAVPTVLVLDGMTFFISALLVRSIHAPEDAARAAAVAAGAEEAPGILGQVREGLRAIADQPLVYELVTGVTGVFFGAGIIVAIGPVFVSRTLGRPDDDWFTMLTFVGAGLIVGIVSVPFVTNRFRTERVYPVVLVVTSLVATALAINMQWLVALGLGATLGAAAGLTVVTGYTLLHTYTADESRGRTFAAFYTGTRVATFAALGLAPFLAGSIEVINIGISGTGEADAQFALSGPRITMLLGGLVALWSSLRSARAIWRAAGPSEAAPRSPAAVTRGHLIAFEGVEGAGKSTQAARLADHLRDRGFEVVRTREPGGTPVAEAVRAVLLDTGLDAMGERTEALLYAAARAEHVAKVIAPALDRGAVVITDRYLDSSLAYQGHARGLGIDEVTRVNDWATDGTRPDVVVLLDLPVEDGLTRARRRTGDDGRVDRLEREALAFHEQVAHGFAELVQRSPDRFVVVDADGDVDTVAARVRDAVDARLGGAPDEDEEETG